MKEKKMSSYGVNQGNMTPKVEDLHCGKEEYSQTYSQDTLSYNSRAKKEMASNAKKIKAKNHVGRYD